MINDSDWKRPVKMFIKIQNSNARIKQLIETTYVFSILYFNTGVRKTFYSIRYSIIFTHKQNCIIHESNKN